MTGKRPKLFHRVDDVRASPRRQVCISGTCQIGDREAEDIVVTDISANGCRLRLVSIGVAKREPLTLRLAEEAPIAGRLKWTKQGFVGVAFDAPLDEAVLERLLARVAPSNIVPLRRNQAA